jgi:hypothetical protein
MIATSMLLDEDGGIDGDILTEPGAGLGATDCLGSSFNTSEYFVSTIGVMALGKIACVAGESIDLSPTKLFKLFSGARGRIDCGEGLKPAGDDVNSCCVDKVEDGCCEAGECERGRIDCGEGLKFAGDDVNSCCEDGLKPCGGEDNGCCLDKVDDGCCEAAGECERRDCEDGLKPCGGEDNGCCLDKVEGLKPAGASDDDCFMSELVVVMIGFSNDKYFSIELQVNGGLLGIVRFSITFIYG